MKALRHDLFPTRMVLERFEREAKAVAKLRHPNILPVYAVGQGDGIAYMIMPVIRGENLRQRIERRALTAADAVRIVADIARALDAAHKLGIVHRDVKPENILLEGEEDHALLTDFGIAKSEGGDSALTGSGVILGSPHYMSPEQAAAERTLDGRSDIYSLGAVAYEALSGRKPYEATSLQQHLVLQFTTEPPPLTSIAATVPAALAEVVTRALARDPANRWPDAGDFANALLATVSVSAPQPEPASWFARRGLIVAVIYTVGIWTMVVSLPLDDIASATGKSGVGTAIELVQAPLLVFVRIGILLLLAELVVTSVNARREGLSRSQVTRRLFGQPHWWQAWYPASLRDPTNIWAEIPRTMRWLKTLLWLGIAAVLFTLPFGAIIQTLSSMSAGVGMALPLPVRIAFFFATGIQKPLLAIVAIVVVGIIYLVVRRRVALSSVARLLFTWRAEEWNTPDGRRLRGLE